jgi:hypothetical protein
MDRIGSLAQLLGFSVEALTLWILGKSALVYIYLVQVTTRQTTFLVPLIPDDFLERLIVFISSKSEDLGMLESNSLAITSLTIEL